jgi:hypothetical protein
METRSHVQLKTAPTPSFTVTPPSRLLQRKCACGGSAGLAGECEGCNQQSLSLQRSTRNSEPETRNSAEAPPIVNEVLRSPGQPLDAPTRAFFEPRFGHNFSNVRVHTDARAAESARTVNALAYTVGQDIVFGSGKYQPETRRGSELLAHELTHSIQQGPAARGISTKLEVSSSHDAAEQEADAAAALVTGGQAVGVTTGQGMQVARQDAEEKPADAGPTAAATPAATTPIPATTTPAAEEATAETTCALTTYTGSNLVGDAVTADVEFTDSLDSINQHASANAVDLHVTSSFRTSTDVPGAIVTPAKMSNHMAGHAIDMNVKYGEKKDQWCNSTCLGGTLPAGVKEFIKAIQDDSSLRWGGDFDTKDPVHIDDNLNADTEAWKKRKEATQAARTSGCG